MKFLTLAAFLMAVAPAYSVERAVLDRLTQLARTQPDAPAFREELTKLLGADNIKKGSAIAGYGGDFVWAVEAASAPTLVVDDQPIIALRRSKGSDLWFRTGQMQTGTSHRFHYLVDGNIFGGANDIPSYTPGSYIQAGVPRGKLSEKIVHTSKIYPGMTNDYWIYVPAQYDPAVPAALMVWQDGERYNGPDVEESCRLCPSLYKLHEVTDNLTHQKKIPVMIQVFISPGTVKGEAMRARQYDSVSDVYSRYLLDEILPAVYAKYNIRKDPYSRAIQGQSSGGICAFNVAWRHPEEFSRVYTVVGSYVSIAWRYEAEAGNLIPFWVRRDPKKNLRVWLNDGSEDQESPFGSWPLMNIQLANSLKLKEYDFHFSFGGGTHHAAQAAAQLPETLTWLWRDYDPAKKEQTFQQEPAEKAKPVFRVRVYNR